MSTVANPVGFRPVGHLLMPSFSGKTRRYQVDASNTPGIFKGDLVKIEADGHIAAAAAATGLPVIGVAVAFFDSTGSPLAAGYLAASTAGYVDVIVDPYVVYVVQEDGAGTSLFDDESGIGATADHVAGTGSTTTGLSGHTLNSDDTNAQLQVLGLYGDVNNAWADTYTDIEVLINEHHYKAAVAGV
jgi:hypothetical protein